MSNHIGEEGGEDSSSPEKNSLRRKWMRDNGLYTSWQYPIYEPNPSCLCDTCEKNYHIQTPPPWDPILRRNSTDTSDEEDLTDSPDGVFDGNGNESKSVASCLSLPDRENRGRLNITGEKSKGETMVVSDKINVEVVAKNFTTLSNTTSDKEEPDKISTNSGEMGLKNTKLKSSESEGEEKSSESRTKDSPQISPLKIFDENKRHHSEKYITREDTSATNGADYKGEETGRKVYLDSLKFKEENEKILNTARLFMESVKDEQNVSGKFINTDSEGERELSDRKASEKAEISEGDPTHYEGYKNEVSLDQIMEKICEGKYEENSEKNNSDAGTNEGNNSDGLVIVDKKKQENVIRHPYVDKENKVEDDKFSEAGYQCRICKKNVSYHFRKQIRERKRSGRSTLDAVEVVNDEIPHKNKDRDTSFGDKEYSAAKSVNEKASQDSVTPESSSFTAKSLPQGGLECTRDGQDEGQEASHRAARASRNIVFNARTGNSNCREHAFCRRIQTIVTRNQNATNSRGSGRRPLDRVLGRNSRGLRAALRRVYQQNRRSLRALTFRDIVDRGTGASDEGELILRCIGAIRILLG